VTVGRQTEDFHRPIRAIWPVGGDEDISIAGLNRLVKRRRDRSTLSAPGFTPAGNCAQDLGLQGQGGSQQRRFHGGAAAPRLPMVQGAQSAFARDQSAEHIDDRQPGRERLVSKRVQSLATRGVSLYQEVSGDRPVVRVAGAPAGRVRIHDRWIYRPQAGGVEAQSLGARVRPVVKEDISGRNQLQQVGPAAGLLVIQLDHLLSAVIR